MCLVFQLIEIIEKRMAYIEDTKKRLSHLKSF